MEQDEKSGDHQMFSSTTNVGIKMHQTSVNLLVAQEEKSRDHQNH